MIVCFFTQAAWSPKRFYVIPSTSKRGDAYHSMPQATCDEDVNNKLIFSVFFLIIFFGLSWSRAFTFEGGERLPLSVDPNSYPQNSWTDSLRTKYLCMLSAIMDASLKPTKATTMVSAHHSSDTELSVWSTGETHKTIKRHTRQNKSKNKQIFRNDDRRVAFETTTTEMFGSLLLASSTGW